jgi:hypothetical protein
MPHSCAGQYAQEQFFVLVTDECRTAAVQQETKLWEYMTVIMLGPATAASFSRRAAASVSARRMTTSDIEKKACHLQHLLFVQVTTFISKPFPVSCSLAPNLQVKHGGVSESVGCGDSATALLRCSSSWAWNDDTPSIPELPSVLARS